MTEQGKAPAARTAAQLRNWELFWSKWCTCAECRGFKPQTDGPFIERMRAVIEAMRRRPWWRVGILYRRPWRAPFGPSGCWWQWLRFTHDCQDPMIGCSCFGGFLFPADCTGHAVLEAVPAEGRPSPEIPAIPDSKG